jgi:hypothetical protein
VAKKKSGTVKSQTRLIKDAVADQNPTAANSSKNRSAANGSVTMDRRADRDRRKGGDRRKSSVPVVEERRRIQRREKVNRRRQIDPTTCERNYSAEEIEFMNAIEAYKRTSGRMFPTCSEILEVLRGLGYEKRDLLAPSAPRSTPTEGTPVSADTAAIPAAAI